MYCCKQCALVYQHAVIQSGRPWFIRVQELPAIPVTTNTLSQPKAEAICFFLCLAFFEVCVTKSLKSWTIKKQSESRMIQTRCTAVFFCNSPRIQILSILAIFMVGHEWRKLWRMVVPASGKLHCLQWYGMRLRSSDSPCRLLDEMLRLCLNTPCPEMMLWWLSGFGCWASPDVTVFYVRPGRGGRAWSPRLSLPDWTKCWRETRACEGFPGVWRGEWYKI